MMMKRSFDQDQFNQFIIEKKIIGFFEEAITLKSGETSYWYVNWRQPTSDVFLINQVADFVIDFISSKNLHPDAILGVPEGATKLGVISQYKWAQMQKNYQEGSSVLPMWRKKPKDHGTVEDRFCIGVPHGRVILIEDVTTSGSSLIDTLKQLLQLNVNVIAAISLSDRMATREDGQSAQQAIETLDVPFYRMSNALELLKNALTLYPPTDQVKPYIEADLKKITTPGS
jgi:orotate phosphoribosyltransferase